MLGTRNNTVSFLETYNKLMAFKKVGKARRKARERAEKPAPGLTHTQRELVYTKQNGGTRLTPRQRARLDKKAYRAGGHLPEAAGE